MACWRSRCAAWPLRSIAPSRHPRATKPARQRRPSGQPRWQPPVKPASPASPRQGCDWCRGTPPLSVCAGPPPPSRPFRSLPNPLGGGGAHPTTSDGCRDTRQSRPSTSGRWGGAVVVGRVRCGSRPSPACRCAGDDLLGGGTPPGGGLPGGGLGAALGQCIHAGVLRVQVARRWHAQFGQGLGHAVFDDAFDLAAEPVPLALGLGADVAGHRAHAMAGIGELFFGHGLGLALNGQALLDQGFKYFATFLLRLGESAQARQPDLLGRVFDGAGELVFALFLVGVGFLRFLDHGASIGGWVAPGLPAAGVSALYATAQRRGRRKVAGAAPIIAAVWDSLAWWTPNSRMAMWHCWTMPISCWKAPSASA